MNEEMPRETHIVGEGNTDDGDDNDDGKPTVKCDLPSGSHNKREREDLEVIQLNSVCHNS